MNCKIFKYLFKDIDYYWMRLANWLISGIIAIWYCLSEFVILRVKRTYYERMYWNTESDPLVTIIIATYNRGKILVERTIPSILNQSYQNFEILIIGDHCIDNTKELITKIRDPRIRFYDLLRRGRYPRHPKDRWFVQGVAPRNKGLRLAKGLWLSWISDDDVLLPNHFESLLRCAQKGNYEFVSASYTYEKNGKISMRRAMDADPPVGGMPTWLYRSYLNFFRWNIHSWRKNWNCPCDYDLRDRMLRAGVRVGFTEDIVTHLPAVEGTSTVGWEAQRKLAGLI